MCESDVWTFERIGMLVIYRDQGLSAEAMSALIGVSKDAICGKAFRLRLPQPLKKRTPNRTVPRPSRLRDLVVHQATRVTSNDPVPFLKRRPNQCAAILDERGKDGLAMVCGRVTCLPHSPWCAEHFLLYTEPRKDPPHGETRYRYE